MAQAIYIGPDGKEIRRVGMKVPKRIQNRSHWLREALRALKLESEYGCKSGSGSPEPLLIRLDVDYIVWELLGDEGHITVDRLASSMAT